MDLENAVTDAFTCGGSAEGDVRNKCWIVLVDLNMLYMFTEMESVEDEVPRSTAAVENTGERQKHMLVDVRLGCLIHAPIEMD